MKRTLLTLVVLIPAARADEPTDDQKITGTWVLADAEDDGKTAPAEELGRFSWTFDGGKYTIKYKTDVREGTYKLDSAKTPRTFDQTVTAGNDKGNSYRGIYKFAGDELLLCFPKDEKADRPKEFTGKAGSGQILMVFKRKKA